MGSFVAVIMCIVFLVVGCIALANINSDIQIIVAMLGFGFSAMFGVLTAVLGRLPKADKVRPE